MSLPDSCERQIRALISIDADFKDKPELLEAWLQIRTSLITIFATGVSSPTFAQQLFEAWYSKNIALFNAMYCLEPMSHDQKVWLDQFLDGFQALREEVLKVLQPRQRSARLCEIYLANCFSLSAVEMNILSQIAIAEDDLWQIYELVYSVKFYENKTLAKRWHPASDCLFEHVWRNVKLTFEKRNNQNIQLVRAEKIDLLEVPYLSL